MKQDRITTAYKGLNADQLAALAFHYLADENELEFKRVASAVPSQDYHYRCPDETYQAKLDGLTRLAAHWSTEYWRLRCRKSEILGAALVALRRIGDKKGDDLIAAEERADDLLYAHEQAEIALLSLDAALDAVCQDKGVDPSDMRKRTGAMPFISKRQHIAPDAELRAAMETAFFKLLDSSQ